MDTILLKQHLVVDTEYFLNCKGLNRCIDKIIANECKIYYLSRCKSSHIIPFHILNPLLKLENAFNPSFLNSNKYNNNFFNLFANRTVSLDLQQALWIKKNLVNEFNAFNNNPDIIDPINVLIESTHFANILKYEKNKLDKKVNRKLKLKRINQYTNNNYKNKCSTTIISNNITNSLCFNFNFKHIVALKKYNSLHSSNLVCNLTNLVIPDNFLNLLSLGPKFSLDNFSLKHNYKDLINLIIDTENIIQNYDTSTNHRMALRNNINNLINKQISNKNDNVKHNVVIKQIIKDHGDFIKWWKGFKKDFIITTSDKTKQTVIISKNDYDNKMNVLLGNKDEYKSIRTNPISEHNNNIKAHLSLLVKNKSIDSNTYKSLVNNNPLTPRIYGLIKAHKIDNPLRPILNSFESPSYVLAKFLNPTLNFFKNDNPYDILNSNDLINKIKNVSIQQDEILISLDVISLFPSIPLNLFYQLVDINFDTHILPHSPIKNKKDYVTCLKLVLDYSYFSFNNNLYKQNRGVPMGGSMSVNVAGIVMNHILNLAITKLQYKPKVILKYIDDLFLVVKKSHIDQILSTFNSINKNIKFTLETEVNNCLNYLDVTIVRNQNNCLSFKWYKKEVSSNRILNYYSNHPIHVKNNTIKNFINRALNLTDNIYHSDIKNLLSNMLKENLYPDHLIKSFFNQIQNNIIYHSPVSQPITETSSNVSIIRTESSPLHVNNLRQSLITNFFRNTSDPPPNNLARQEENIADSSNKIDTPVLPNKKFVSIPFISPISLLIKKEFSKMDVKNMNWSFKPINRFNQSIFTNTKDRIEKSNKTNVVYQINCSDCDQLYIGQTKQHVSKRINQHVSNCNSSNPKQVVKTMLSSHANKNKHKFDFENVKILHTEANRRKRELLESFYIAKNLDYVVNERKEANNLHYYYSNIITQI